MKGSYLRPIAASWQIGTALLLFAEAGQAMATGNISGTVKAAPNGDLTGATIPGATVTTTMGQDYFNPTSLGGGAGQTQMLVNTMTGDTTFHSTVDAATAGEEALAAWLRTPADPAEVAARQEAVAELRLALDLREHFALLEARPQPAEAGLRLPAAQEHVLVHGQPVRRPPLDA